MIRKSFKTNQFSIGRLIGILLLFLISSTSYSEWPTLETAVKTESEDWATNVLNEMTLREKIGQLFMVAAYSNRGPEHQEEIEQLIKNYSIGGLIFFQGGPTRQARLSNQYQSISKIPLFIAMDAEWGLAMRLDSTIKYPRQVTLGAIKDSSLIYEMGAQIAEQTRRLGMQINFAPVLDINVNPLNPVIGTRSFGENKEEVAKRGYQYMKGMQDNFVLANAKHFPGHGDTDTDSHYDLPVINHDMPRLTETELYPFQQLFDEGMKSVMVAHIHIPVLDSTPNKPTTLSRYAVTDLLKNQMKFNGLVFTDALNMKGVASYYEPGETDLLALKAGNDVLLYPEDVAKAVSKIEEAVLYNVISEDELDAHVLKILEMKQWSKIQSTISVNEDNLYRDLNQEKYTALNYRLRASALTLLNKTNNFPLDFKSGKKTLSITIGKEALAFNEKLRLYADVTSLVYSNTELTSSAISKLKKKAADYDHVVVSIKTINNQTRKNFGVTQGLKNLINAICVDSNVVTCHYGNLYSLANFEPCANLICGYEKHNLAEIAMAQAVVGALNIDGKLPASAGKYKQGDGYELSGQDLLGFDFPYNLGMDSYTLTKIDSIMSASIDQKHTPGGQVLIAKQGKIVYQKSFGRVSSDDDADDVTNETIYDLASVTKVLATGIALMKLEDEGKIILDSTLGYYLPELKGSNKENMVLRNVLAHQAGFKPFLPYWSYTVEKKKLNSQYYASKPSEEFHIQVAENIYANDLLIDSVYKWTTESELLSKNNSGTFPYKYSDMGYYYTLKIIEKTAGVAFDQFLEDTFYSKMNLSKTLFNPLNRYAKSAIAPTEKDTYFRNQLIHGYVHDQGASMIGGVAGHAGLFSNSFEVAQLLQMLINGGHYNQTVYLNSETINKFVSKQLEGTNRKGATWDRMRPEGKGPSSDYASSNSFGHSGFTGTLIWADPDYDLVYVFLSNRINPDASNKGLVVKNVRTKIQDLVYLSILNFNAGNGISNSED